MPQRALALAAAIELATINALVGTTQVRFMPANRSRRDKLFDHDPKLDCAVANGVVGYPTPVGDPLSLLFFEYQTHIQPSIESLMQWI